MNKYFVGLSYIVWVEVDAENGQEAFEQAPQLVKVTAAAGTNTTNVVPNENVEPMFHRAYTKTFDIFA